MGSAFDTSPRLSPPDLRQPGRTVYPIQYESMKGDRLSQSTAQEAAAIPLRAKISAAVALLAAAVLRAWMLRKFFEVNGDSRLYGDMAKNLLVHSRYALSDNAGGLHPTLIRLPGYPLFLAACFHLFGSENYFAPACVQIVLGILGCGLLALFVYRIAPSRNRMAAAQATLWLAALCPFTAIYDAEPLTEALTLFSIALALWSAARFQDVPGWDSALAFTFAVTYSAFLRPDGALVGVSLVPAVAAGLVRARHSVRPLPPVSDRLRIGVVCLLLALAPFAAWTWRNWSVFHVIQPLAPRYATDPGEDTWPGFQRWMKTWCLDFVSTYEIYWNVPAGPLDLGALPPRAIDSPAEHLETARIAAAYEANGEQFSSNLDHGFDRLAEERIRAHPLRYYVLLPIGRVFDMWFRPRVENLPIDLDWWAYSHHHVETRFSWFYAGLNAFYVVLALVGLCLRPRLWVSMLAYMLMRSALLSTIEAPEARYTIECFPMLFALGGIAVGRMFRRASPSAGLPEPLGPF